MRPTLFGTMAGGGAVTPIALVANVSVGMTGVSGATSAAIDTTGATLLVIAQSGVTGLTLTPTDSKGNTWTALTAYAGGSLTCQLYYCANPVVESGHTFTVVAVAAASIAVGAFSGTMNAAPDSAGGAGAASGTTQQPGLLTPSVDNCLVVTGFQYVSPTVPGPGTISAGFTITDDIGNADTSVPVAMAYQVQTTATGVNPTWSSNAAAERISAAMAVFKHV